VDEFVAEATVWLDEHVTPRASAGSVQWGVGEFDVAVFHDMTDDEERTYLAGLAEWHQIKAEAGYHAITWDPEWGGLGLSNEHARAFANLEMGYEVPGRHELFSVTTGLVAPTVLSAGTDEQKERFVRRFLLAEEFACQLFSEPGAGSDLASLACRAERDGDEWVLNGQKVWTSGARFSGWGLLIARSDPTAPKHKGQTAFLVPFDTEGVEVRPIKQMSGGTSFNEVFFNDARLPDSLRLGEVGEGWGVALTTLAHERANSGRSGARKRPGGGWQESIATARAFGATADPVTRAQLMEVYSHEQARHLTNFRVMAAQEAGAQPGPEGSIGKLYWVEGLPGVTSAMSSTLGPRLIADTGEWGSYEWGEHVLGSPGYRIAGGSDEIQRNIIGERVLGLPRDPQVDKSTPWNELPR